jgi:hypothetical protein
MSILHNDEFGRKDHFGVFAYLQEAHMATQLFEAAQEAVTK